MFACLSGLQVVVEHNDKQLQKELQAQKALNPFLKTLISIGGYSFSTGNNIFEGELYVATETGRFHFT